MGEARSLPRSRFFRAAHLEARIIEHFVQSAVLMHRGDVIRPADRLAV